MDFKQLRSFVAIIRYGSFTTAASKLRISQPTVSTHIRQLEEELGTPLVVRNAKRVELTANGYKMYDQAVSLLAMHDKMLQKMRRRDGEVVYLGASSIPSAFILPALLPLFYAKHADAHLVITQDSSQGVVNGMLSGLFELGFVGMPVKEDTLDSVPFYRDEIVLVTPNTERFREIDVSNRNAVVNLLTKERTVMRKAGSATRAVGNRILDQLGLEEADLNVFAHLDDQTAAANLVESGLCVALVSNKSIQDAAAAGQLLSFEIPDIDATREFYVLKRKNVPLGDTAEALYNLVTEWSADNC